VYAHHAKHYRDFPWRRTSDPYRIVVSEFMLQQTQTDRVVEKYRQFIKQFPTLRSLAHASQRDVLRAWGGLGYNRRALALKKTAETIIEKHGGKIPEDEQLLRTLPGIGPYTAAAIRAFAFDRSAVCVETNIRSAFIHWFFPGKKSIDDAALLPLIEEALDRRHPRKWYNALMDYGSWLKSTDRALTGRSTSFVRQTPFRNSGRFIRGRIIALLVEKTSLSEKDLFRLVPAEEKSILLQVQKLVDEKMIVRRRGRLAIPA
jgi:A/G-specific adenine glycosylase